MFIDDGQIRLRAPAVLSKLTIISLPFLRRWTFVRKLEQVSTLGCWTWHHLGPGVAGSGIVVNPELAGEAAKPGVGVSHADAMADV
jgi:hypothetical protein